MPEQQTEKSRFDGLMDILAYSAVPFTVGVFFASFIFLYGYIDFAHLISAAIEKNCGVK